MHKSLLTDKHYLIWQKIAVDRKKHILYDSI